MVEEITDNFEKAMKKGFLSILILAILEKNPTHGYRILKQIEEKTLGVWKPPSSSLYTVLKTLQDQDLIKSYEIEEQSKVRKIYELTPKGEKTLKIMYKKHRRIRRSIHSLLTSTLGDDDILIPKEEGKYHPSLGKGHGGPFGIIFDSMSEKPLKEQIDYLKITRDRIKSHMKMQENLLKNIEKRIEELEKN